MLHVDAHFARGRSHAVCQDYALATAAGAVVCDGCSSAPHSDVGARLLAHAAASASMDQLPDARWLREPVAAQQGLGLPTACLDATCILARVQDDGIGVCMLGDGVVAARQREDDALVVVEVSYAQSAPPYPSYALCPHRSAAYADAGLGSANIQTSAGAPPPMPDGRALRWWFPRSQYSAVMIGSDGLGAFRRADQSPVPSSEVVSGLFRFPSPRGAFLTRRLKRYLSRDAPAEGLSPHDDVAVAALCWGCP